MKSLFTVLLLLPAVAGAIGLQDEPVGSQFHGSAFQLGNKRIPMADGDWTLIARHTWTGTTDHVRLGTNFAGVYLADIKEGRLARAVSAWGNVDPNLARGWIHNVDPCKRRENLLAYKDLSASPENQLCYDVSELRGYMKKSTAWRQQAQRWLEAKEVELPPDVLMVRFARLERAFWTEVYYYFPPQDFAGATLAERALSAAQWAEEMLPAVRAGLATPGP